MLIKFIIKFIIIFSRFIKNIIIYIIYIMSGTSGMVTSLAAFNSRNTATFYPELYRIKLLILNAFKKGYNAFSTSYSTAASGTPITDLISILQNLQFLFPSIYIYYSRTSTPSQPVAGSFYLYSSGDFFVTTSSSTYWIYISQISNATYSATSSFPPYSTNTGSFVLTFAAGSGLTTGLASGFSAPFIVTTGVSITSSVLSLTSGGAGIAATPILNTMIYATVTITYTSGSTFPTADYGISFTPAFKSWITTATNANGSLTLASITNVPLSTAGGQFSGITSAGFAISTAAIPIIRPGTSLANCFSGSNTFNSNISAWDTSNVTSMASCFSGCSAYNNNGSALTWNTTKVTNMSGMFQNATIFNQAITYNPTLGYWNTAFVTTIANIFNGANAFANASGQMSWILTGLNGYPGVLTASNVATTTTSSIYLWKNSALTAANAPLALTLNGAGGSLL